MRPSSSVQVSHVTTRSLVRSRRRLGRVTGAQGIIIDRPASHCRRINCTCRLFIMPRVVLDSDDEEPDTTSPAKALLPPVATCSSNGDHSRVSGETGALASTTSTGKPLTCNFISVLWLNASQRSCRASCGLPILPYSRQPRLASDAQQMISAYHLCQAQSGVRLLRKSCVTLCTFVRLGPGYLMQVHTTQWRPTD